MKKAFLVLAILFASTANAQTTSQTDAKTIDEFFTDQSKLALSGCDSSTWEAIHAAIRSDLGVQPLPESTPKADYNEVDQLTQCLLIVNRKKNQAFLDFRQSITKTSDEIASGDIMRYAQNSQLAGELTFKVLKDGRTNTDFLMTYGDLTSIESSIREAEATYISHAEKTRYNKLVEKYNSLANSLTNVRLAQGSSFSIQPRALHCESSTNPATQVTRLDCQ